MYCIYVFYQLIIFIMIFTIGSFEKAISNPEVQKQINVVLWNTNDQISALFERKYSSLEIGILDRAINDNIKKNRSFWIPAGNISFKRNGMEYKISIDTVLTKFPYLKSIYEDAIEKKEKDLHYPNNRLIACVLAVIDNMESNKDKYMEDEKKDKKKDEKRKMKDNGILNVSSIKSHKQKIESFQAFEAMRFMEYCKKNWIKREDGKDFYFDDDKNYSNAKRWIMDVDAVFVSPDWKRLKLVARSDSAIDHLDSFGDDVIYDLVIIKDTENEPINAVKNVSKNQEMVWEERQHLADEFDSLIWSEDGVNVNWKNYRFIYVEEKKQFLWIVNWKVFKHIDAETKVLPKWSRVILRYNELRNNYINDRLSGKLGKPEINWGERSEIKGEKTPEINGEENSDEINPDEDELVKVKAVVSDVTGYYLDMIENKVSNELNAEWQRLNQGGRFRRNFNLGKIRLFFTRWRKKKKMEEEMRKSYSGFAFTGDEALDKELSKQASRHDYEEGLWMNRHAFWEIKREELINNESNAEVQKKFKEMCEWYIAWAIPREDFQRQFNEFIEQEFKLPKWMQWEQFIATNVLDKLDAIREDNKLLDLIIKDLEWYLSDRNKSHFDSIKKLMDVYFESYKRDPRFRSKILSILWTDKKQIVLYNFTDSAKWYDFAKYCKENWITRADGLPIDWSKWVDTDTIYRSKDWKRLKIISKKWATSSIENVWDFDEHGWVTEYELVYDVLGEKIERFIKHEKALAKMSTNNLKVKLDLLSNGKGAHQINDDDHKKSLLFRASKKFDEMPRIWQALSIAGVSAVAWTGVALAWWSAVVATAVSSAVIWWANFFKKIKHYTDEQKKVEWNIARDSGVVKGINSSKQHYEAWRKNFWLEELKKGPKWRWERYKARKHRKKYWETTHSHLLNEKAWNTRDISDIVYNKLNHYNELPEDQQILINWLLLDSLARLQTYRNTWHNFLKWSNREKTETDFYNLENSLDMCAKRIFNNENATIEDLTCLVTKDRNGKDMTYEDILDFYNKDYETASKKFDDERKRLAALWWFKTAIISFGISAWFQFLFGRWMFADHDKWTTANLDNSNNTDITDAARDYYELGKYHVTWSKTFELAQHNISTLPSSDTVTLKFWAGTNPVPLSPDSYLHTPGLLTAKLNHVIQIVQNSHLSNIDELVGQLENLQFPTNDATWQAFLSYDLHAMRCLDVIENAVKWSQDFSGALKIDPVRNSSTANDLIGGAQFVIEHANVADSVWSTAHSWTEKIIIPGLWVSNEFENPTQWIDEVQGSLEQDPLNQQDLWKKLARYDTTNDELKEDEVIDEPQVEQIDESKLGEVNNQYKRNSSGQQLRNAA